jgi:uncharacterized membrane protein
VSSKDQRVTVLESTESAGRPRRLALRGSTAALLPWGVALVGTLWALVWTFAFSSSPGRRYGDLATYRFDLGNMTQAVWNTAHGHPLELTLATGEQASRLGVHVDPILALFAPLWWLFPSPVLLAVVQAGALASGAYPVLRLAERRLESTTAALLVAAAYLLYPWLVWQAYREFHPVALAIPALLWAVWFLESDRLVAFVVAAGLGLVCGELVGLALVGLGAWYALSTRRWRRGALIAGAGAAWTALCLWVIIPAFSGDSSVFYQRFEGVGGSPGGLAKTAVTDPGTVLSQATSPTDFAYVAALLAPLAGFVIWAPLALLAAVPQLAVNVLSDWDATTSPQTHYVSVIVPFLFVATIAGLARFDTVRRRIVGAAVVVSTCLLTWLVFAPWPGVLLSESSVRVSGPYLEQSRRQAVRSAIALVPDDSALSATNRIAGHLSERHYVYSAPVLGRADWVVIDDTDAWIPQLGAAKEGSDPARLQRFREQVASDARFRLVFARDGVYVFRRAA